MSTVPQHNPLWQYALEVYALPGVEPALLCLQDDYGLDINWLLACLWMAGQHRPLSEKTLNTGLLRVSAWQRECVQPLREVRRYLKGLPGPAGFREAVKQLELEAEQWQTGQLWQLLQDSAVGTDKASFNELALANLQGYCRRIVSDYSTELTEQLQDLIALFKR